MELNEELIQRAGKDITNMFLESYKIFHNNEKNISEKKLSFFRSIHFYNAEHDVLSRVSESVRKQLHERRSLDGNLQKLDGNVSIDYGGDIPSGKYLVDVSYILSLVKKENSVR